MRIYNETKNMIISTLAAALYCYSCMNVPDHDTELIIYATIGMFLVVYLIMLEIDSIIAQAKRKNRRKSGSYSHSKANGGANCG